MTDEAHFRPLIQMGMRYDVWISHDRLRMKQGVRKREVPLEAISYFGVRRSTEHSASLTELRIVAGDKALVLPYNPNDDQARALLAKLAELRPDADVSGLMWSEAAPLLGVRAFGLRDTLMHPWVAGGLGCLLLAPVAVAITGALGIGGDNPMMGVALAVVMGAGAIAAGIGVLKVRASRRAEEEARQRRVAAAQAGDGGP